MSSDPKTSSTTRCIVGSVLTLVAVLALIGFTRTWKERATFAAKALVATGTVLELRAEERIDDDGIVFVGYRPVVRFFVDGDDHVFEHTIAADPPDYERGDVVNVLYSPDNPRNARIDSYLADYGLMIAWGLLTLFFGWWGIRLLRQPERDVHPGSSCLG